MTQDEVVGAANDWRIIWNEVFGLVPEDQNIDFQWNWPVLATPPGRCVGVRFMDLWIGLMVVKVDLESHSRGTALVCERVAKRPDLRLPPHRSTFGVGEAMIEFLRLQSRVEGHGERMLVRDAVQRALNFYLSGGFSVVSYDRTTDTFWMEAP